MRDPLPSPDRQQHENKSQERHFQHLPRTNPAQVDPHQQGDRNRHRDGEGTPRAVLQRIHHDQRNHRQQDDQNRDHRHIGDDSSQRPGFFLGHFGKRLAVAPHRKQQDDEILHAAGKHRARNHPERSRQISKLSRQHWTDERARTRDGRKMMSEDHPLVGDQEIAAVFQSLGRRRAQRIDRKNLRGDESAVEPVPQRVATSRGRDQPESVDRLSTMQRNHPQSQRAQQRDTSPQNHSESFIHGRRALLRIRVAQRKPAEPQYERAYPNDFLRAIPRSASLPEVLLLMFRKTARHVPGPTTLHTRGAFCGFILNRYLD